MQVSLVLSVISLAACVIFFIYCRAYLRRRTGSERILAEFREEVYQLIGEIDAATDKDALLVEERIKNLRSILEEVDKRMNVHLREMDRRRSQEEAYAELGRKHSLSGASSALIQPFPTVYDRFAGASAPVNTEALPHEEIAAAETELPAATVVGFSPPGADSVPPRLKREPLGPRIVRSAREITPKAPPFQEQVADLSKAGLSAGLIAARLGVSLSEVELAIAIAERS
ncbi:MAG: hypothetical protein LBD74_00455 [Spirochaetaceae bacterium]|jgi:hypothetical protein|nr:hypothetical protein [Spirochaetaceae bacterium]